MWRLFFFSVLAKTEPSTELPDRPAYTEARALLPGAQALLHNLQAVLLFNCQTTNQKAGFYVVHTYFFFVCVIRITQRFWFNIV